MIHGMRDGECRMNLYEKRSRFLEFQQMIKNFSGKVNYNIRFWIYMPFNKTQGSFWFLFERLQCILCGRYVMGGFRTGRIYGQSSF